MKIILATAIVLFTLGCSDNTQNEATKTKTPKAEEVKVTVTTPKIEEVKIKEVVKKVEVAEVVAQKIDGQALFTSCAGCHGVNGEKKALGKSAVIQGWDSAKVENALNGYKNGSYGGAMKGMMSGQVARLGNDKIKALAEYISTL